MNPRLAEYAKESGFDLSEPETSAKVNTLLRYVLDECVDICTNESKWWKSKDRPIESSEAAALATMLRDHFQDVNFKDT